MKKIFVICVLLLLSVFIVNLAVAEEAPAGDLGADAQKITDTVNQLPVTDTGEVDVGKLMGWKTKADERIEAMNKYIGWLSQLLFGMKMQLSWVFVYSILFFILIFSIAFGPVKYILKLGVIPAIISGIVIAVLAMHSIGPKLVVWMNILASSVWLAIIVCIILIILSFLANYLMKLFGVELKKDKEGAAKIQEERDKATLKASAKIEKEKLGLP